MLSDRSILRRLPTGLDQKQLVFLDGIRHAAEITWLAYVRLETTLTWLVDNPSDNSPNSDAYTSAFMDAWSAVDAIDRFRSLWKLLPGLQFSENGVGEPSFENLSRPIRGIRNVSDHLAQRAEYVAASGNPVMGLLTWVTYPPDSRNEIYCCVLAPGTRKKTGWKLVNPIGLDFISTVAQRTGMIHLAAGEHQAHLSAMIPAMQVRIRELESGLEDWIGTVGLEGNQAGADFFIALKGTIGAGPPEQLQGEGEPIAEPDSPRVPASAG